MNKELLKWLGHGREDYSDSVVYVIAADDVGLFKIGTSIDVHTRLQDIQYWSPVPLRLLAQIMGDKRLEARIHRRFNHLRRRGEWFEATDELRQFVEDLAGVKGCRDLDILYLSSSREVQEKFLREIAKRLRRDTSGRFVMPKSWDDLDDGGEA